MIRRIALDPAVGRTTDFARLAVGELNRASRSRSDLSGKGVNVSVALTRFGLSTPSPWA